MSRVVELKRITGVLRRKGLTILLTGSFVIGLLYGVLLIAQDNAFANEMASLSGMKTGAGEPVWLLFIERLGSSLAFLVIPYFFGFCAVGQPLCCGAGCGILCSGSYGTADDFIFHLAAFLQRVHPVFQSDFCSRLAWKVREYRDFCDSSVSRQIFVYRWVCGDWCAD